MSQIAAAERLSDVLPALHEQALAATGGTRSLLFEHNPRTGALHPTSGYGLADLLFTPWITQEADDGVVSDTFSRGSATFVSDLERQLPDLAVRLGSRAALLVPIARNDERIALLTVGFESLPEAAAVPETIGDVADTVGTGIELFRYRAQRQLQRDVRTMLDDFAAALTVEASLDGALATLCSTAARITASDRASVWLHDRGTRLLTLCASSDSAATMHVNVSAEDADAPVAIAMRQPRATLWPSVDGMTSEVTAPLRIYRRTLGTLLFEGVRIETGSEFDFLERADEVSRQISSAVETLELIGEIRRRQGDLQGAFNALVHLAVVTDPAGVIRHANNAFLRRSQQTREQLIGNQLADYLSKELARWVRGLPPSPLPGGFVVREMDDGSLNGVFFVTVSDFCDADGHVRGRVFMAPDRLAVSHLEVQREARRKQMTQAEKLAALGQFVAGIAHELNNPLQSVLGHLELLRATGAVSRAARPQIRTISREADRAAKIVKNLLVFAGSGRLARRPVQVNAVLRRVIRSRQHACRVAHVEIVRHYDESIPRINSDPLMLHQVFLNVVLNAEQAVAASGRHGRIEVASAVDRDRRRLIVTVRDTGTGIPESALSRVFEPFFTTKDVGKGTGLGLAISYGIVHDHGGTIAAANHPEGGALFTIELPLDLSA